MILLKEIPDLFGDFFIRYYGAMVYIKTILYNDFIYDNCPSKP